MNLKRIAVVASVALSGVGLFVAPARADTVISVWANSEAGRIGCTAVASFLEARKEQAEGYPGNWYYCAHAPDGSWVVYER
ncbi:hypothetical protein [Actinoallomurus rhizosphaericola]|uniref:hypothetical protein n=1 Tax=Actinoallomurus rhizosphaericola TaxID=2952536 RepID=UPI00209111B1|nr:hypothetical protein [Actinoallomurus rhizosphaericola]MCO5992036.1 hypothetical protein [Actinoallomurus rhizosphaericola]